MMPPKGKTDNDTGLLEYLEDIIGTDQYVAPLKASAEECVRVAGGGACVCVCAP